MSQPTILTIAGSDPSGGAGIQADLKTFEAHRGFGTSVITALTAQNTVGVEGVWEVDSGFVAKQLTTLIDDLPPKAIKSGMLASTPIIQALIKALGEKYTLPTDTSSSKGLPPLPPLVIDPVSVSTSNHRLLSPDAVNELVHRWLPLGKIVTPNAVEAGMIARCIRSSNGESKRTVESKGSEAAMEEEKDDTPGDVRSMVEVAECILDHLPSRSDGEEWGVLVKGGHVPLTATAARQQLAELKRAGKRDTNSFEVIWNGETLEVDAKEEGLVEILSAYRRTLLSGHSFSASGPTEIYDQRQAEIKVRMSKVIVDVLLTATGGSERYLTIFVAPAVESSSTHGTGCTLSAAIASNIGHGKFLKDAVREGIEYVQYALITAEAKGRGHGPLNHQCMTASRNLPLPTATNPHPFMSFLLRSTPDEWRGYVRHPFVIQLGKGTLPIECFRHYIIQDWHYLRHYARAHALAASKTTDFDEIKAFSEVSLHIARESEMHVDFCRSFGVSTDELLASTESPANYSYSQYILDVGHRGDNLELVVAVLSCLVGYGEVGLYLLRQFFSGTEGYDFKSNRYQQWIQEYSGRDYQDAVSRGIESLERRIAKEQPSPARLERLVRIWKDCLRLETNFWQMGLDLS